MFQGDCLKSGRSLNETLKTDIISAYCRKQDNARLKGQPELKL